MTQSKNAFRNLTFTLVAILPLALLAFSGCSSDKPTNPATQSKNDSDQPSGKKTEGIKKAKDGSVLIQGDLSAVDWSSMIGQQVTISGDLIIVDTFDLIRRGQVKVARNRLMIPTNRIDPNDSDPSKVSFEGGSNVASITQAQKANDQGTIILDDGSADENIFPPTLFPLLGSSQPTVRIGSTVHGVQGKLVKAGSHLLLVPSQPLQWTPAERPQRPEVGEAKIKVASFNVLNYFTTIDDGQNRARGADSESEFKRQEEKLVSALIALDADVIGLMELENNLASENRLVQALNQKLGKQVFKGCGLPKEFRAAPGGQDAIRVGIIYRSDRVAPQGPVTLIQDHAFHSARTPIVQSFQSQSSDCSFTLIVNHFKSKGGSDRADSANKNKGDGQGAYNAARRKQAFAICQYIESLNRDEQVPRVLVIGDLNAYGQEDPIDAMRANGLVDLHERLPNKRSANKAAATDEPYSFIYYGQAGRLDHAMATSTLAKDITGIAIWHINSDEPRFVDYNEEHRPKSLYEANPYRSSDHDPVLIGIGK